MTARASTVVRASAHAWKLRAEHLVVAAEVARILQVGRDPHDVGERRALLGEDAGDRSIVAWVSSSIVPSTMLPSASLPTWPETKMKSPARTAGWNGRFGFLVPIG